MPAEFEIDGSVESFLHLEGRLEPGPHHFLGAENGLRAEFLDAD